MLEIKGNVAGDILIFIVPKNNTVSTGVDILNLIQSDHTIVQQRILAFKLLRQKFNGLILLPKSIVWTINISISAIYVNTESESILANLSGAIDFSRILHILPLAILAVITHYLATTFGFKLLKPSVLIILWIVRHFRKTGKKEVA